MAVVLGIDAAWTEHGSSGVALLSVTSNERSVLRVAPSYADFIEAADRNPLPWGKRVGSALDVPRLLGAAERIARASVDVVAIDMPMSGSAITGSRKADREVARAFSSMYACPYTPRADRPGAYGRRITEAFNRAGFPLATSTSGTTPSLIEVFPLAALVRLVGVRPTYKATKTTKYWRHKDRPGRMKCLLAMWGKLEAALQVELGDLRFTRPSVCASFASLKPFEDALDALTCAWVGLRYLEGTAEPFGDDLAAIWVPLSRGATVTRFEV